MIQIGQQDLRLLGKAERKLIEFFIGMGGILNAEDAIEMILADTTAVSVGTANFTNPHASEEIVDDICAYMERYQVSDTRQLICAVHDR